MNGTLFRLICLQHHREETFLVPKTEICLAAGALPLEIYVANRAVPQARRLTKEELR